MEYASIISLDFSNPAGFVALGAFVVIALVQCCEWLSEFRKYDSQGFYRHLGGAQGGNAGICAHCGHQISYGELNPPKPRCSRSLHNHCYEARFNRINRKCQVCGDDIRHKTDLQEGNGWREIGNHLCDRHECKAAWALMHAGTHGMVPQNVGQVPQYNVRQVSPPPQAIPMQSVDPDVMDAEYIDHNSYPVPKLNIDIDEFIRAVDGAPSRIEHHPLQLPEPERQWMVPEFDISDLELVPVSHASRTRDDGVIEVDLPKPKGKKWLKR